ncbi:2533_t:CDS:2 [Diversispora eburnea]|uniref:2533_t:CDS:1 n=1 Tax=Diversispora eburnea TaxID=1213867 RepID=A0A9N9EZH2_9GLOM|nr:2533_t:CDS:2 [Diversispora eburnea]
MDTKPQHHTKIINIYYAKVFRRRTGLEGLGHIEIHKPQPAVPNERPYIDKSQRIQPSQANSHTTRITAISATAHTNSNSVLSQNNLKAQQQQQQFVSDSGDSRSVTTAITAITIIPQSQYNTLSVVISDIKEEIQ